MKVLHTCELNSRGLFKDGILEKSVSQKISQEEVNLLVKQIYRDLDIGYRKFYKMDIYCKTAMVLNHLLPKPGLESSDPGRVGVFLANKTGCTATDINYFKENTNTDFWASPAKFVYTLPNIMIGELCIKNGIQGENLYFNMIDFNKENLINAVELHVLGTDTDYALCGWIDPFDENGVIGVLYWVQLFE
ncbi:MAG: hypothetical protein GY751_04835 [Bacteroidetes bacterium]|nr:hypothetical protein [Bacteroidota bacterium]